LLPNDAKYYIEPFGGSASVLLNRPPAEVETLNDVDSALMQFFTVLRKHTRELTRAIALTPFSRDEYVQALETCEDPIENARRFYIRIRQGWIAQSHATEGSWMYTITSSSKGMGSSVAKWIGSADVLPMVADRLRRVQLENQPATRVVTRFDHPDALFYCDPPYMMQTRKGGRGYTHEMSFEQHQELATTLKAAQGRVAITHYDCPEMRELYSDWHVTAGEPYAMPSSPTREVRQDFLWTNYDPQSFQRLS
jgi:DNA adenine methylase